MHRDIELHSTIRCPHCGYEKDEVMPTNACLYFYKCTNCETLLKAEGSDCCVFCSYGTVKCPSVQAKELKPEGLHSKRRKGWVAVMVGLPAALLAALPVVSCPLCWPFYTALLGSLGISFMNYTPYVVAVMAVLFAVALVSMLYQAKKYKLGYGPLVLGSVGSVIIIAQKLFHLFAAFSYIGIAVFLMAIIWNAIAVKKAAKGCNTCN